MTFSKIDKKVLIIAVVALIIVVLGLVFALKYFSGKVVDVKNTEGGAKTEAQNEPAGEQNKPTITSPSAEIKTEPVNPGTSLSICVDECGNGVCQKTDPQCGQKDGFSCICEESHASCPADCK